MIDSPCGYVCMFWPNGILVCNDDRVILLSVCFVLLLLMTLTSASPGLMNNALLWKRLGLNRAIGVDAEGQPKITASKKKGESTVYFIKLPPQPHYYIPLNYIPSGDLSKEDKDNSTPDPFETVSHLLRNAHSTLFTWLPNDWVMNRMSRKCLAYRSCVTFVNITWFDMRKCSFPLRNSSPFCCARLIHILSSFLCQVSVDFTANGKPESVYHWNLPLGYTMPGTFTTTTTTTTTTTPSPPSKKPFRQNFFNNGKPQKLYFVKPSLMRHYPTTTTTEEPMSTAIPTTTTPPRKVLKKHYFRGNGKPNQLYFVKRAHYINNSHL